MNAPIQYIFGHQSLQDGTLDDDDIDREDGVPNEDEKRLAPTTSRQRAYEQDPFGDEECMVVQYRTMEWWHASFIMIAETISLGILSLPSVLATVGLVPGVILIVGLGIITTYTGYTIWQFKMAYPHVSIAYCYSLLERKANKSRCTIWQMPVRSWVVPLVEKSVVYPKPSFLYL